MIEAGKKLLVELYVESKISGFYDIWISFYIDTSSGIKILKEMEILDYINLKQGSFKYSYTTPAPIPEYIKEQGRLFVIIKIGRYNTSKKYFEYVFAEKRFFVDYVTPKHKYKLYKVEIVPD